MAIDKLNITDSVYFVRNNDAIIDSLFAGNSKTAAGVFKILKNRVMFYDMQGELFAALVVNKEPFFVNATNLGGKVYYQHALGEIQECKLGIEHCGYVSQRDKAANIAVQAGLWEY